MVIFCDHKLRLGLVAPRFCVSHKFVIVFAKISFDLHLQKFGVSADSVVFWVSFLLLGFHSGRRMLLMFGRNNINRTKILLLLKYYCYLHIKIKSVFVGCFSLFFS